MSSGSTSTLFPSFKSFTVDTSSAPKVTINGIRLGTGPPLLLLHGYPQTHHIWHVVAPALTSHFTVICLDLRGYGASSKPAKHEAPNDHSLYAKSAMAADCAAVMRSLGFDKFAVCGHDRGGRVTHKLAIDYPDMVTKAMVLDIAPTKAMFDGTDQAFATAYWHWFFLIQPAPFPEAAMLAAPELFAKKQMKLMPGVGTQDAAGVFHEEAWAEYAAQFKDPACVHGMCEDYRAAAQEDIAEQESDIEAGRKIKCPLRVLWGKKGVVEKKFNAVQEWEKVCEQGMVDKGSKAVACGHYIPEEMPDDLVKEILDFFGGTSDKS